MKNTIIGILIITAVFGIIFVSVNADKNRNKYWDDQYQKCGRVGWYYDKTIDGCMPVEHLQTNDTD